MDTGLSEAMASHDEVFRSSRAHKSTAQNEFVIIVKNQ